VSRRSKSGLTNEVLMEALKEHSKAKREKGSPVKIATYNFDTLLSHINSIDGVDIKPGTLRARIRAVNNALKALLEDGTIKYRTEYQADHKGRGKSVDWTMFQM
jgi:hypothetical protein